MRNTDGMLSADKQPAQLLLFCPWWKMNAIPSDSFALADLFTHALLFISITLSCGCCRLKGLKRSSDLRFVICGGKHVGSHPRLRTASLSLHITGGAWGKMEEKLVLGQEHRLTSYLISSFTLEKNPRWRPHVGTCASACFWSSCSSHIGHSDPQNSLESSPTFFALLQHASIQFCIFF